MATDAVPLTRSFSPVPKSEAGADKEALRSLWGHQKQTGWEELEKEFRCVILAGVFKASSPGLSVRGPVRQSIAAFLLRPRAVEDMQGK